MRALKIQITSLVLVAICFLGGDVCASAFSYGTSLHRRIPRADNSDDQIPGVLALNPGLMSAHDESSNVTIEMQKPSKDTEIRKKPTSALDLKTKNETKYLKAKELKNDETPMMKESTTPSSNTPTIFIPTVASMSNKSNESTEIISPFLLNGESISDFTTTERIMAELILEDENTSRARALNITAPEPTNSLQANLTDPSNVTLDDDEDKEIEEMEYASNQNETKTTTMLPITFLPPPTCLDGNKSYEIGEEIIRGCESKCVCGEGGIIKDCEPVCVSPYVRAGKGNTDPFCQEEYIGKDECCAIIVCSDSAPEPEESCLFGNKTIPRSQRIEDGCSRVCVCEAGGILKCQPRCPPNETTSGINQHDRCVALTDPRDSCCTITLCDVSLGEHEIKSENVADLTVNLTDIKVLNTTAIKLKLSSELSNGAIVEISENNHVWRQQKPDKSGILSNLEPAHSYYVRITEGGRTGPALRVNLPAEVIKTNVTEKMDKNSCSYRGKHYKIGAEWYDECISLCICGEGAKSECVTIECPTDFGLDVLDPHCLDWETVPANFMPKAPHCCPQEVRCRNNGSCEYQGGIYDNWSKIPTNVSGCEKTCHCQMGKVNCQETCPPIPASPPATLECPPNQAVLSNLPDDDCCSQWTCDHSVNSTPGMDSTSAYPGPLTTNMNDHPPTTNDRDNSSNKTSIIPLKPTQESDDEKIIFNPNPVISTVIHYPMDPGNPASVYNGPYNPDYKPTESSVEEIFRLPGRQTEKIAPPIKDKSKSKTDMKKPVEPMKPHKDIIEQQLLYHHHHHHHHQSTMTPPTFLDLPAVKQTPPVPTRPNEKHSENPTVPSSKNHNKISPQPTKPTNIDQPQFISLNEAAETPSFTFSPSNGENIPPTRFDPNQFGNQDLGPPYIQSSSPKKKTPSTEIISDNVKTIKPAQQLPGKTKPSQRKPEQETHPDELLHLINLHHPGLTQLDHPPPQGHPGLYEFHQQIANQGDHQSPANQIPPGYFNAPQLPKKTRPQIVAHKNEDGQTTYHIHTPEIPNSPQQIEELLAHLSQHDQNLGPFQQYPNQPSIIHNYPNESPPLPPQIDSHYPNSAVPHLNHPFTIKPPPNQSGVQENFPAGFSVQNIPGYPSQILGLSSSTDAVVIKALEALDDRTVRLVFTVPPVLVGLHGRVELRYTSDQSSLDPSTWKSQTFFPPNDLIATPQLEFELDGLEPATEYKVRVTVNLEDIGNSPSSKIYNVKTLDRHQELTTLPPQIPIDAELRVMETNSSWVNVMWKKFTEYEMQFIDGVQLRYKEHDGKVYAATPLIHRAVTSYVIENLKPATTYEIGISIIPFPGQTTELISDKTVLINTSVEPDPYSFDVKVEVRTVKSQDVEVTWSGVPYPEDKYVNIYRAIYQSDSGKEDTSTFKIAKRDSPAKTVIGDLKPGTRYRLWIEVYLTNGKIKKSNVQDFITKPGVILTSGIGAQGKLASIPLHEGDYYGPLVIVAIVASLSILSTLILLMMLMKRRSSSKADISPRKTTSAYDNPSYKTCEDVVTITNGRNKANEHEMSAMNPNNTADKESA